MVVISMRIRRILVIRTQSSKQFSREPIAPWTSKSQGYRRVEYRFHISQPYFVIADLLCSRRIFSIFLVQLVENFSADSNTRLYYKPNEEGRV